MNAEYFRGLGSALKPLGLLGAHAYRWCCWKIGMMSCLEQDGRTSNVIQSACLSAHGDTNATAIIHHGMEAIYRLAITHYNQYARYLLCCMHRRIAPCRLTSRAECTLKTINFQNSNSNEGKPSLYVKILLSTVKAETYWEYHETL